MEGERKSKKLDLDWSMLLPDHQDGSDNDDEPLTVLVVQTAGESSSAAMDDENQQRKEFNHMSDKELNETIERNKRNLKNLSDKLPDKGEKLRASIKRQESEIERRLLRPAAVKNDDGCEKPTQFQNPSLVGTCDGSKQVDPSSLPSSQSAFASHFCRKLEGNTVDAFEAELSCIKPCGHQKVNQNGQFSSRGRRKGRGSSSYSFNVFKDKSSGWLSKKRNAFHVQPSNNLRPRNGQPVVLVDEEEPQLIEPIEKEDNIDECMKEAKIYYPSRNDPETVEICYSDMECLAPESFLSSTIMNFYIRYLQQPTSSTNRTRCDTHFFNTYFYKKLKEAVLKKRSDKENAFEKFRRWWKGVNIFDKAYILLPIHDVLHWSLVIICIPDKEDESGPIILHLDSLGLHPSKSIFCNVKSFLREEWNYLNKGQAPSDLPIARTIWENLPSRILEKEMVVPQQKNDYDCGVFVLFFMEHFIQNAPERLKKKDIGMFGKHWFGPEEPYGLRHKIKNLLAEEFKKASENTRVLDS